MTLKEALRFMFLLFCVIVAFQLGYFAVVALMAYPHPSLHLRDILRMLQLAALGVLPIPILIQKETASYKETLIRRGIHFVLTAALVFGALAHFQWIDMDSVGVIVGFFFTIFLVAYFLDIQAQYLANQLNKRISAFRKAENANRFQLPENEFHDTENET